MSSGLPSLASILSSLAVFEDIVTFICSASSLFLIKWSNFAWMSSIRSSFRVEPVTPGILVPLVVGVGLVVVKLVENL